MKKSSLKTYLTYMLKNYADGTVLQGKHKELALKALESHPHVSEKVGCGVQDIVVRADGNRGKHFEIVRTDGSRIDFSYRVCLWGASSKLEQFRAACRTAVIKDIRDFRDEVLKNVVFCRHRGIRLDKDNSIVDHVKPKTFNMLVGNFISSHHLDIEKVEVGGDLQRVFVDPKIAEKFREYHKKEASLELVYWEANNFECR